MLTLFASMAAMTMMAGDFKVSGNISGLADGTKLVLVPMVNATAQVTKAEDGIPRYTYSDVKITDSPLTDKLNSLLSVRNSLNELYTAFNSKYTNLFKA